MVAITTTLHLSAVHDLIDQYAEKTLQTWNIPGLSLAIVHKGQEVKVQGYGYRARGQPKPVDANTVFQIASLTKAFTSLTAALLVDEHKLDWNFPVRTYLPDLRFNDPVANAEMGLSDLLSHKTGLPGICHGEDSEWYKKDCSTEYLMGRLASIEPLFPFRSCFSYSNLAYVAVSQMIQNATSLPWDAFCKARIFDPLGMTRTYFSYELLMNETNRAEPHLPINRQLDPIIPLNWDSMKAAGGINSCAQDLVQWMNYSLLIYEKKQLLFHPHTVVNGQELIGSGDPAEWEIYSHNQAIVHYGFGWMMYELADRMVYFHIGLSDGMSSVLALVPAEALGIAILTNQSYHLGDISLLNELLDYFLHLDAVDWHRKSLQVND